MPSLFCMIQYMRFPVCPMRKHKQPPLLLEKVVAVNLSSHFGPSCPEDKIPIHHHMREYRLVIGQLVVRQKKATRYSLYIKTITRTSGGNRSHGNFTPPHADGATVNAVKRSNRKYHCANQKIIARQIVTSAFPQLVEIAHAPFGLSPFQRAVLAYPMAWLLLD